MRFERKDSTDAYLVFQDVADYEAARDQDGNNRYEINIQAYILTKPERLFDVENWLRTPKIEIVLLDVPDNPTVTITFKPNSNALPVMPMYSRQGDHITIKVREGEQPVFKLRINENIDPAMNDLTQDFLDFGGLFDGADGDRFTITRRNDGGPNLIISFTDAPNHERPTDADGNNVYQFGLGDFLDDYWGELTFEVTVTDNPLL